ncbi:MAG: hypothetical protein AB1791_16465 [Chloroflexota bacterium]
MSREARRTPPQRSLLAAIQGAAAAFTGRARLVEERPVSAAETTFRGGGFRLTAEIAPEQAVFGPLPEQPVRAQGDTTLAAGQRTGLDAPRFPPDDLRQELYWTYARPEVIQPVLVIMAEPAAVYALSGPADDLPAAVQQIHGWTQLPVDGRRPAILDALPASPPTAWLAGFELLMATNRDLPGLAESFLALAGRPGAATQGILDLLYRAASPLPPPELAGLAGKLLAFWPSESEPAALLGYLTWFDAHRRAWEGDETMKAAVRQAAQRSASLTFTGPYAAAWQKRVRQQTGYLVDTD